jgi:hypothetical protein
MDLFNEFIVLVINYHLLCFTNFLSDPDMREYVGYSMIMVIIIIWRRLTCWVEICASFFDLEICLQDPVLVAVSLDLNIRVGVTAVIIYLFFFGQRLVLRDSFRIGVF